MEDRHEGVAFGVGVEFELTRERVCYTQGTTAQTLGTTAPVPPSSLGLLLINS